MMGCPVTVVLFFFHSSFLRTEMFVCLFKCLSYSYLPLYIRLGSGADTSVLVDRLSPRGVPLPVLTEKHITQRCQSWSRMLGSVSLGSCLSQRVGREGHVLTANAEENVTWMGSEHPRLSFPSSRGEAQPLPLLRQWDSCVKNSRTVTSPGLQT